MKTSEEQQAEWAKIWCDWAIEMFGPDFEYLAAPK